MTPERWARVERALDTLLDHPSSEWSLRLEELCGGDGALEGELRSLLGRGADIEGFLDRPPLADADEWRSAELDPELEGRRLGSYRVVREIARGGMGWVYLAEDTTLDRPVALKVLPPDLARDPGRAARFEREARIVASLNHPNIVTIHSIEETDGVRFLTMELVEGTSLDSLIRSGPLPVDRFLDVALPLAEAVGAAHERGVTHRDLKPANVMLTDQGHVKVLDFGVAKLWGGGAALAAEVPERAGEIGLTEAGAILGTVHYMAPEQIRGLDADHRSDLFSLGVLFFELLTGVRPFRGVDRGEIMQAILTREPPPIRELRGELPDLVGRIVERCLRKEPEGRFESAVELAAELRLLKREMPVGEGTRPESTGEAHEYYLRGRRFFYRVSRRRLQFARQLYERAIDLDPEYALAHVGLAECCSFLSQYAGGAPSNLERADEASRTALERDPELPEAHAARGLVLSLMGHRTEAEERFRHAVRLDPSLYEGHYFFGRACQALGDYERAARLFGRAGEVRPDDYEAPRLLLKALAGMGASRSRVQAAARRALEKVHARLELNPDDTRAYSFGAPCLLLLDDAEKALEWTRMAEELEPGEPIILYNKACLLSLAGEPEEAIRALERAVDGGFVHREWVERDPELAPLRNHPRFAALMGILGHKESP